mmetsp:Transcript_16111/g.43926  ORF Transcript_16111/g.43926 Transcript_16111/m.43926 type:complete len:366 (-) Transcript_16111:572-1669(-)
MCCHRKRGDSSRPIEDRKREAMMLVRLVMLSCKWCTSMPPMLLPCPAAAMLMHTPARMAPSSEDRPQHSMSQAMLKQKPTSSSCTRSGLADLLRIRSSGRSTVVEKREHIKMVLPSFMKTLMTRSTAMPFCSAASSDPGSCMLDLANRGPTAKNIPTNTSWVMSVPTVICPNIVPVDRRLSRHLTTIDVLLMDSRPPTNAPVWGGASNMLLAMNMPSAMLIMICSAPPSTATFHTERSFASESSMPSPNSSSRAPSCASVSTCTSSWTSCRPPGPATAPATSTPFMVGMCTASASAPNTADAVMRHVMSDSSWESMVKDARLSLGLLRTKTALSCVTILSTSPSCVVSKLASLLALPSPGLMSSR